MAPVGAALNGRTVLLTGGSGVVGQALLERLAGARVRCLTHRAELPAGVSAEAVRGDIRAPRLGLDPGRWAELAAEVDVVVHAAATTDLNAGDDVVCATNVEGTRRITEFAAAADAQLYHFSTAFLNTDEGPYARSKGLGEQVVRDSGVPAVILRPSIVIGATGSGRIAAFQGIYFVASAMLTRSLPLLPFGADWLVDVIPQDVVADVVVTMIERGVRSGEYWLTAGADAPTVSEVIAAMRELAPRTGRPMPPEPRYVTPDLYRRLIEPVFRPPLPPVLRRTVTRLFDHVAPYLVGTEPYPCDLPELRSRLALPAAEPLRDTLVHSLDHWAMRTGYAPVGAPR